MMIWYEQSVEEYTYRLGEVACTKSMYRRTKKVQGIKSSEGLATEDKNLRRDDVHEAQKGKHIAEM
jgi:hypothetical protein